MGKSVRSRVASCRPLSVLACSPLRIVYLGLRESRPVVQVIFATRFLSAGILSLGGNENIQSLALATGAWLAATVAVYVFNGITDVAEDQRNSSVRPIASGRLPLSAAVMFTTGAVVLAIAIGAAAGIGWEVCLFLFFGYCYSGPPWPAKCSGLAASLVITMLGGLTFWTGAVVSGNQSVTVIIFGVVMSAWMGLVGALVKDLGDISGDALAGRRTFAVVCGKSLVAYAAAGLGMGVGIAGLTMAWLQAQRLLPSMAVLVLGSGIVAYKAVCVASGLTCVRPRAPYRAFMVTQYVTVGALWATAPFYLK